jgi:hypothetical protein
MAEARNEYGVTVPALSLGMTKTYHGLTLIDEKGQIVGRVQSFKPTFGKREGKHLWELNAFTFGRPIDYVPGKETGRTISCSRVEIWGDEFEVAIGPDVDVQRNGLKEWSDLCEQTVPFIFQDALFQGNSRYRAWEYLGCWFTSKDLSQAQADGDAIYIADIEMAYITRRQLQ